MKKCVTASLCFVLSAGFAFAEGMPSDRGPGRQAPGAPGEAGVRNRPFGQVKAEVLSRIQERVKHNQEELACVQAATGHDALRACRERFRQEMRTKDGHRGL